MALTGRYFKWGLAKVDVVDGKGVAPKESQCFLPCAWLALSDLLLVSCRMALPDAFPTFISTPEAVTGRPFLSCLSPATKLDVLSRFSQDRGFPQSLNSVSWWFLWVLYDAEIHEKMGTAISSTDFTCLIILNIFLRLGEEYNVKLLMSFQNEFSKSVLGRPTLFSAH